MKIIITSPVSPTPELQTEDGVRIYLSRLSKLSRSELCIELCYVMSAKHNLMMFPIGIHEYAEKQEIVTDLTDKATAICFFEFGQASIISFTGGDLSQLNALINNVDKNVAELEVEPERHGELVLQRLSEVLQPQKSDEEAWFEQFLNQNPQGISYEDYELLKDSPFIIFILMASADGEVDLKESVALADIVLNPEMFENELLVRLIRDAIPEIHQASIQERLAPLVNENHDYLQKLKDLARVLDENFDAFDALQFKQTLIRLGYKIADASGGFFGFGSRVCEQEKKMLQVIAAVLRVKSI